MNCPNCQIALRPDSSFCTGCGQALDNPTVSFDSAITQLPVSSVERNDQAKQNRPGDPLIGHLLDGKYQLVSRLGQGGMGTVYRARRIHIGDEVAVKVLHTRYVAEEEAIERFRREARAAAQLRHPNVVVIYDYGEAPDAGVLGYIVMELVEGTPLGDILEQEGRLKPERAIALMRQICAGVSAAHKRNIVHRDLKPDNIVVLPAEGHDDESIKVVDFGLAKLRDQLGLAKSLTQTGMIIGTPNYMSPEQCRGDELDSRADVYSLGAILFEMLAGEKPFNAPSAAAVIVKHLMDPPPSLPNENELPPALTAVCRRALSKNASERQADASDLGREISEAANPPTRRVILPQSPKQTMPQPESPGTQITGAQTPLPTLTHVGAPHYPSAPPTPEVERRSKGPLIGIMLAIVAVLAIAGVVGAFLLSKSNVAQTENANSNVARNVNTDSGGSSNNSTGPIGGDMRAGQANSSSVESSRLGKAILGKWKTKTGKLEIEFKEAPTGIEGIILRVPDSWPKSRVNIGDAIFVKGKLDGARIEGLYINVPQNADCPSLETRYSKCVISFVDNNTLKVTNSAWKYSFPACAWSLVTYDDTWNWSRF